MAAAEHTVGTHLLIADV